MTSLFQEVLTHVRDLEPPWAHLRGRYRLHINEGTPPEMAFISTSNSMVMMHPEFYCRCLTAFGLPIVTDGELAAIFGFYHGELGGQVEDPDR